MIKIRLGEKWKNIAEDYKKAGIFDDKVRNINILLRSGLIIFGAIWDENGEFASVSPEYWWVCEDNISEIKCSSYCKIM